jgi:hypothetical protein
MGWRKFLPIGHQLVEFPERKLLNLMQRPPGSGRDVAKEKGPVGYTGTGTGSPAEAFLSPETSRTELNSALKSS